MKYLRAILSFVALLSLSTVAFAQSDAQKPPSDSQKAFDKLKTLAGSWEGRVTTVPPQPGMGDGALTDISLRVTSRGNAMVHEMKAAGTVDDPARYDHPVTMFYLDSDRLLLTHYCDAGIALVWRARCRPTEKRRNSNFSMSPATRSTDTCTMPCSPSSTLTITPRIGPS
jgi:hypothetical protein